MKQQAVERVLYNKSQTAQMLGIAPSTLNNYYADEKISCVRIGDRVLFSRKNIDEFVARCTVPAKNPVSDREALEMAKRVCV